MNAPITPESLVNSFVTSDQTGAQITTLLDGSYVVVWQSFGQDGDSNGIVAQRFSAQGEAIGTSVLINDTALGSQADPSIAATDDGGFVVVWEAPFQDEPTSVNLGVIGRRFNVDMTPASDEFIVNSVNVIRTQDDPVVAGIPGGGFAVAYVDSESSGFVREDIRLRLYDSSGTALGDDFAINDTAVTAVNFDEFEPAIATIQPSAGSNGLVNGGLVVAWRGGDASGAGVIARVLDETGAPIGAEFQVNTTTSSTQGDPAIAGLTGGRFVIVWEDSSGADASGVGVAAQVFEGDGTAVGGEIRVNVEFSSSQFDPAVAATTDGGFVVTWTSNNSGSAGDGNGQGVISRRFDVDGNATTGEEIVNQTTTGEQFAPAVTGLQDGNFVSVWTGPDDSGTGIYQRIAGDPASFVAPSASPEVEAVSTQRTFLENALNAAPQRIDADGAVAVSDFDSTDFDGGRLIVSLLSQSLSEDEFPLQDQESQDVFGLDVSGVVSVSGTDVSVDGTVVGSIGSGGTNGQPLVIDLNADADAASVEVLIENLTYQNLSDDPRTQLQVAIQLEDGDGASSDPVVVTIDVTPESDTDGFVRDEIRVNTFTPNSQDTPHVASTFDPVTGAINGYVVVWTSNNQDVPAAFDAGVFGQRYDANRARIGQEFQINLASLSQSQFDADVAGLTDGGFVIVWTDDFGDGSSDGVRLTRYDVNGQPVAGQTEVFVNTETSSNQNAASVVGTSDGGYQVTWNSVNSGNAGDGSSTGVFTQRFNSNDQPVGGEQQVNEETDGAQDESDVAALNNGRTVVVWTSATSNTAGDGASDGVFARLFDGFGVPEGGEFQVNTFTTNAQVDPQVTTLTNGNFVVVWRSEGQDNSSGGIYGQMFTAAGVPVATEFRVNDTTSGNQTEPSVIALDDGRFVVSWTDTSTPAPGSGADVFAQVFDTDGGRLDSEVRINQNVTFSQGDTAMAALPGGNYVVVWESDGDGEDGFLRDIQSRIVGDPADFTLSVAPAIAGIDPVVTIAENAANAGALIVPAGALTLTDADSADLDGGMLTISRQTTDPNGDNYIAPDDNAQDNLTFAAGGRVSVAGTDAFVDGVLIGTISADGQGGADLIVAFNADATVDRVEALLRSLTYTNTSDNPRTDRSYALELTDGDGSVQNPQSFTISLTQDRDAGFIDPVGTEQQVNTFTTGVQRDAEVAVLTDGGWVVVWQSDDQDSDGNGIFAQRYNADGSRNGAEFQVNSTEAGNQTDPVVAGLSNGGFVISWEGNFVDDPSVNDTGILGQIYDATGATVGGERVFNTVTSQTQNSQALAADPNGGFVVSWTSDSGDTSGLGIKYQRFNNDGTLSGAETLVNQGVEAGSQFDSDLVILGNGNTLVVWETSNTTIGDGSGDALFGQVIDPSGNLIGTSFPINQETLSSQSNVQVVATGTGFAAVWQDNSGQDSSGLGVQARFFDSAGAPVTDEFTVNENRSSTQSDPRITVLDDGRVVITWQSQQSPNGSGTDISGQIFSATGARIDGEFRINTEISSTQSLADITALPNNNFVVTWQSETSGNAGDGDSTGVFQQIFGNPADFAQNLADQILGLPASVIVDEVEVNAGPVRLDLDKTAAVPSLGVSNLDGGTLEISIDFVDPTNLQFAPGDDPEQHQLSFLDGEVGNGDVLISGSTVSVDGTVVGVISSDGTDGQPLTVSFNANADQEAVEALLGNLAYANTSDDPDALRLAVNLTTGTGVSAQTSFIEVAVTAADDIALVAGDERRVNAHTQNTQRDAAIVELTGGGYVVVWESSNQDEIPNFGDFGVYAQVYSATGAPVGPEIQVNSITDLTQDDPHVAATSDGGFVVVFTGDRQDDPAVNDRGIIAQRFNADGSENGGEVIINNPVADSQFSPSVSAFTDGGYVVSFVSDNGDGGGDAIRATRVDATGAVVDEITVNTTASGSQSAPDVATRSDINGNNLGYVVVWTDPSEDGSGQSVRGRLVDASGTPIGTGDFRVSTTTLGDQFNPSVGVLGDGSFVVAWTDDRNDGSSNGIFAQRYDASGNTLGGEFRVNDTTTSGQADASVAPLANGGFVITWAGNGVGESGGVFSQTYDATGARVDGEQLVNVLTNTTQSDSSVIGLSTGGYAVAYSSETSGPAGDGSSTGVFVRTFQPVQPTSNSPVLSDVSRSVILFADDVTVAPVLLDTGVAFSDPDNANFDGGTLFVYYTRGPVATDQLSIETAGGVSLSGSDVLVGATIVGTLDGTENGANGVNLSITFNSNATVAAVKAVFEALAFSSTDTAANITNTDRSIGFLITDGNGGQTEPDSIFLDINAGTNTTALQVTDFGTVENGSTSNLGTFNATDLIATPQLIDADIQIDDFSGAAFGAGSLLRIDPSSNRGQTISVRDEGTGAGEIGFDGTTVTFGGTAIGTLNATSTGVNGATFQIDLNTSATVEAVEALAENLTLQLANGTVGTSSSFQLVVNNGTTQATTGFISLNVTNDVVTVLPAGTEETQVNTFDFDNQASPRIASLENGGYVVVWTSEQQDNPAETSGQGIFGQVYNEFGRQVGVEFQINDLSQGDQIQPRIAALDTGDFVVAWTESTGRDGSGQGVFAQRFDAAGAAQGDVFLVNETTTNTQNSGQIADLGSGRVLMVWVDSSAQDGSGAGIFGRTFDATGTPEGGEFQINTTTSSTQNRPRIVELPDGDVMVVWQDNGNDGNSTGVFAQRIDSTGSLVDFDGTALPSGVSSDERQINTTTSGAQDRPDVAALAPGATLPNGGFVVVWESPDGSGDGIFAQIYDISGVAQGGEFRVNTLTGSQQADPVPIGTADGNFVVVWHDDSGVDGSSNGIVAQRVGADGSLDGAPFIVNSEISSTQDQPEITELDNGSLVAVWRTFADSNSESEVSQTIIDPAALPAGAMNPVLVGFETAASFTESGVNGSLQLIDPDSVISLTDMDSPDFDGGSLLVERVVGSAGLFDNQLGTQDGTAQEQVGILDGDGITISGTAVLLGATQIGTIVQDGTGGDPLEVSFNANATPEIVETLLTRLAYANTSDNPAATRQFAVQVADGDGGTTGSQLVTIDVTPEADRLQVPVEADDQVNSYVVGNQDQSSTATLFDPVTGQPSGYVVVWQSADQDRPQDASAGIYGQVFDLNGDPVGGEFRVNAHTEFVQSLAAVTGLSGGGFVVAWQDNSWSNPVGLVLGEVNSEAVYGRVFDGSGAAIGDEILINEETQSSQNDVALDALSDGGFAAVWSSANSGDAGDGSSTGVFARTFDADGTARAGEFGVNTVTLNSQSDGDVTELSNGNLVFTWTAGSNQDGSSNGVFARITDQAGNEVVPEFLVNTLTNGSQLAGKVQALSNGNFVVVWQDDAGNDGNSGGVFQQLYASDGSPIGGEVRVNESTVSAQFSPELAALSSGGWVVTWSSNSGFDVFAQVYAADGRRVDGEFRVNSETSGTQNGSDVAVLDNDTFVISFSSSTSGSVGDGDGTGIFQQIFAAPGNVAQSSAPEIQGLETSIALDESALNSGLQVLSSNVTVGDLDSADFAGGRLTLTMLDNDFVQEQFLAPDDGAQDQLGIATTLGNGISVSTGTVSFNGTAIGTIVSNGVAGNELTVELNGNADALAVERLIESLGYANTSDDPELARQIALTLTDGDGGATRDVIDVTINEEQDAVGAVGDEVQTNSFTPGEQVQPSVATLFDPVTGLPDGYVITWTSTNQDATGDNQTGVFGQQYDASGAPVGGEFQVNTNTSFNQFNAEAIGLATGGFAVTWEDNSFRDESSNQVYAQVFDQNGQKVGGEIFVDSSGGDQNNPALASYANGDFVIVRQARDDQSPFQDTIVAQRFSDTGGTVGIEFEIEDPGNTAFAAPDVAVLGDGKTIVVFQANNFESNTTGLATSNGVFGQLYAPDGSVIGGTFQINSRERSSQDTARVAAIDGGFVVVWESDFNDNFGYTTSPGLYGQRFDVDGNTVGDEFLINEIVVSTQNEPEVIGHPGGGFTVVYSDINGTDGSSTGVFSQTYDADGNRVDGRVLINQEVSSTQNQGSVAALGDGNYVAAWRSDTSAPAGDGSGSGVFHRLFGDPNDFGGASGDPVLEGINRTITFDENTVNGIPQLIDANGAAAVSDPDNTNFDGGSLLVSNVISSAPLIDQINSPDDLTQDVLGLRQGPLISIAGSDVVVDGSIVGTVIQNGLAGTAFEIALNTNATPDVVELLVENLTYRNVSDDPLPTRELRIQLTDGNGGASEPAFVTVNITPTVDAAVPLGGERQANTETSSDQDAPAITTLADGSFVIVWESFGQDGSAEGVYGQRFDALGNPVARDGSPLASGLTDEFQVNSSTTNSQLDPAVVATTDGGFLVSWTDNSGNDGSGLGVFAQRFDVNGSQVASDGAAPATGLTGEFQVNVLTSSNQDQSDVAALQGANAGSFVSVWHSETSVGAGDGNGSGVIGRVFTPAGQSEFVVNTENLSEQDAPQIIALADGGFYVVWQSFSTTFDPINGTIPPTADGSRQGVFAQRFDSSFTAVDGEIQINQRTASDQFDPQVAALQNGNLVVTWTNDNADGSSNGVFAQIVDPNGNAVTQEFRVNDQRISSQLEPDITALDTGGFVISWQDNNPTDGSGAGVFAQQYNAGGNRIDSQFQVNTEFSFSQFQPVITPLENGGFAIAWTSVTSATAGDGSGNGVFYQVFANAAPQVSNVQATGFEDTPIILDATVFEAGFIDPDGQTLQAIQIGTFPASGQLLLNNSPVFASQVISIADLQAGNLVYQGNQDFNGLDGFEWTGSDGISFANQLVTAEINVTPVNDAPGLAVGPDATIGEGTTFSRNLTLTDPDNDTFTFTIDFDDGNGATSFNSALTTQPISNVFVQEGTYNVSVTVDDNAGETNSVETDTFVVTVVNAPPVAVNDFEVVSEDAGATNIGAALQNDFDPGLDAITLVEFAGVTDQDPNFLNTPVTLASGALLSFNSNGEFIYNPNGRFESLNGSQIFDDSFNYTIRDTEGAPDIGTFTIRIDGQNDAPVAEDDDLTASSDTAIVANVLADNGNGADFDVDSGSAITVIEINGSAGDVGNQITLPSGAVVRLQSDGTLDYDPTTLPAGTLSDSFTYTIRDITGDTGTATVSITIDQVNQPPVAQDDSVRANEDTGVQGADVLADNGNGPDSDPDSNPLTVVAVDGNGASVDNQVAISSGALVTLNADGTFDYDPNGQFETLAQGESTSDTFAYTISDGLGGTAPAVVTVIVDGENDDPITGNVQNVAVEDGPTVSGDLLSAASDVDTTDTLSILEINGSSLVFGNPISLNSGALLTVAADGSYTYDIASAFQNLRDQQPATEFVGFTVSDGNGGTDTGTLIVGITGTNDDPTAQNDTFSIGEDVVLTDDLFADNSNGADNDIDALDTFTVSAVDGTATDVGRTVTLSSGALLTVNASGTFTYDQNGAFDALNTNESDTDTFTYTIEDNNLGTDAATVTITIQGNADRPIAEDDSFALAENDILTGQNVLNDNGNGADDDPDNDPLTVTELNGVALVAGAVVLSSGASVVLNSNGTFIYNPGTAFDFLADGEPGSDSFTYTISDGLGLSDIATVTIDLTGENDAPTAENDAFGVGEDDASTQDNLFANNGAGPDTDPDTLDSLSVVQVNGLVANVGSQVPLTSGALLTVLANGDITYAPNGAFESLSLGDTTQETFTYTISDGNNGMSSATASVTISGANDAPVAVDDTFQVIEDQSFSGNVIDGVNSAPDSDIDQNDTLSVTALDGVPGALGVPTAIASGATVTLNADGTFTYDPTTATFVPPPAPGAPVTDTFEYTISDGVNGTDTATVTVTVQPIGAGNTPPVANSITATFSEDAVAIEINLLDTASDVDGDDLDVGNSSIVSALGDTIQSTLDPETGLLSISPDQFQDLDTGLTDTLTVSYEITDGFDTILNTATVTITGENDAPEVNPVSASFDENQPGREINLLDPLLVTDVDGEDLDVANVVLSTTTTPAGNAFGFQTNSLTGTLSLDDDTFDELAQDEELIVDITYDVTDGTVSVPNTASFTITGVNDEPSAADDLILTDEDNSVTGDLLADNGNGIDDDIDLNDSLSVTAINGDDTVVGTEIILASGALLTVNADGTFDYDPNGRYDALDENGTDSDAFTYQISDGNGGTDTADVTVSITGVNDLPVANSITDTFTEDDIALNVDLLQNASDVDDVDLDVGAVTVTASSGNTIAYAVDSETGELSIAPGQFEALDTNVDDLLTINYQITDGTDTILNTAEVTITGVNDAPIANSITASFGEDDLLLDVNLLQTASDVDDIDLDVGNVTVTASSGNTISFVVDSDTGELSITPGQFEGLDTNIDDVLTIDYQITDGEDTILNTAEVTITGVNDAPVVSNTITALADEDDAAFDIDLLQNTSDVDLGETLSVINPDSPATGFSLTGSTLTVDPTNAAFQSLSLGQNQVETFNYTVTDGDEVIQTFAQVTITGTNDDPDAVDDSYSTDEGQTLTVNAADGVLANDTDIDALDSLTADLSVDANGGMVFLNSDGSFTYMPNADFVGTDTFSYEASDGRGGTDIATVSITVNALANNDPVAADDSYSVNEDALLTVDAINGVLSNDTDVDLDTLFVLDVATDVTDGQLTLNQDGSFTYDPDDDFFGTDEFTYRVSDGRGGTDIATATITVDPINDDPIANDDTGTGYVTDEDTAFTTANVLLNDTDTEQSSLTVISVDDSATLGEVTSNGDGTFDYDPNGAFEALNDGDNATDTFVYTVSDGNGGTDTATVTVEIDGVDDATGTPVIQGTLAGENLVGSDLDDIIRTGGGSIDFLTGGGGSDIFVIEALADQNGAEIAFITDYEIGVDKIDLNGRNVAFDLGFGNTVLLILDGTDFDYVGVEVGIDDIEFV